MFGWLAYFWPSGRKPGASQVKAVQPAVFVGHGSPMHGIGDDSDVFVKVWKQIAADTPRPKAIVSVSAHWYINEGPRVTAQLHPPTIHDFGRRFPDDLFAVEYPAPGHPELAKRVAALVEKVAGEVVLDSKSWGLDHGTWTVLRHMYPEADIPIVQLSIDATKPMDYHYRVGQELSKLRDDGVLILGSGNVVHNFDYQNDDEPLQWAHEFAQWVKDVTLDDGIDRRDAAAYPLVHWQEHKYGKLAQSSPDHFLPVLYIAGAARSDETFEWDTELFDSGAFSMAAFTVR